MWISTSTWSATLFVLSTSHNMRLMAVAGDKIAIRNSSSLL